MTEAEVAAAAEVLRSGLLRQGPRVAAFESVFAQRFGGSHAVACGSGTAALRLAYMTAIGAGDEVLLPALTFPATASMVADAGGIPVPCEVDPATWLIDLDDAARRLTPRTRAIVPVHLFGNVCDPAQVGAFAEKHGLKVVWDAAQAHGATWDDVGVAAFGPISCFSFYATKNLFVGEGGMVCLDDAATAARLRRARSHGLDDAEAWIERGFNYRMTDVEAAIGLAQLQRFDVMLAQRRSNAAGLKQGIAGIKGLTPQSVGANADPAWHVFAVRVDAGAFGLDRQGLADALAGEAIGTRVHSRRALDQHPYFRKTFPLRSPCATADRLAGELLALPVHHDVSAADVERIVGALTRIADAAARG